MGGPGDVPHAPVFRLYHPFPNESRRPRAATRALGDACPSVRKPRPPPLPRPARQGELRASPSLSPLSVKPQPPARLLRSGLRLPSKCSYRTPLPTSPPPPETHALGPPPPAAPAAGLGPPRRFPRRCSGPSPSGVRSPWGPQTCLFPSVGSAREGPAEAQGGRPFPRGRAPQEATPTSSKPAQTGADSCPSSSLSLIRACRSLPLKTHC